MRLPRFVLACLLFVSPTLFAQHSSSSGSHSSSSSGGSHSSSSSSHSASASSASHASPSMHTSTPSPTTSSVKTEAPKSDAPKTEAVKSELHEPEAAKPEPKPVVEEASAEKRVLPPEKEKAPPPKEEPDLRWRILCGDKPCQTKSPATPPELRHHVCLTGACPCPTGEVAKNGGCAAVAAKPVPSVEHICQTGQVWNGATCGAIQRTCHAGQVWNGTRCQADCSILVGREQQEMLEVRSARQDRDSACRASGPGSSACAQAETHYQLVLTEYTGLYDGAPLECRASWPPPTSI